MGYKSERSKISKAIETLNNEGFYTGSLYHVDDVKRYFKCNDDEAFDVLDSAIDNDGTAETIWIAIKEIGDMMGLEEKEDWSVNVKKPLYNLESLFTLIKFTLTRIINTKN